MAILFRNKKKYAKDQLAFFLSLLLACFRFSFSQWLYLWKSNLFVHRIPLQPDDITRTTHKNIRLNNEIVFIVHVWQRLNNPGRRTMNRQRKLTSERKRQYDINLCFSFRAIPSKRLALSTKKNWLHTIAWVNCLAINECPKHTYVKNAGYTQTRHEKTKFKNPNIWKMWLLIFQLHQIHRISVVREMKNALMFSFRL